MTSSCGREGKPHETVVCLINAQHVKISRLICHDVAICVLQSRGIEGDVLLASDSHLDVQGSLDCNDQTLMKKATRYWPQVRRTLPFARCEVGGMREPQHFTCKQ